MNNSKVSPQAVERRLGLNIDLNEDLTPYQQTAAIASGRSSSAVQDPTGHNLIRKKELIDRLLRR